MRTIPCILITCGLLAGQAAFAEEDDEAAEKAKEHFFNGKELVEEGALDKAILEFKKSYELKPVSIVLYNIGVCYDELHQYADAMSYYRQYLSKTKNISEDKKADVEQRINKIKKFIGTLKLLTDVEGAEIIIDDKLVGTTPQGVIFVETGMHDLVVRKTGYPTFKKKFTVISGELTELKVPMEKEAEEEVEPEEEEETEEELLASLDSVSDEPDRKKKLGPAPFWAMIGVTGATFAAVAVTGSLALKTQKEFDKQYREDEDEWRPLKDRAETLALTTDILIGVGSAAAITSLVLFFFTDFKGEKKNDVSLSPVVTGTYGGVYLEGKF